MLNTYPAHKYLHTQLETVLILPPFVDPRDPEDRKEYEKRLAAAQQAHAERWAERRAEDERRHAERTREFFCNERAAVIRRVK